MRLRWVGTALVATCAFGSAQDDWFATIEKAHDHHRYAVRRAVSNRIGKAGDEVVPALRRFVDERDLNSVSLLVVDALARSDVAGAKTIELLAEWAREQDFYWRSQALGGLAARGLAKHETWFESALADRSHLFRVEGARGLVVLGGAERTSRVRTHLERETDPRARLRIAVLLVESGEFDALEHVVASFAYDELSFLGDPWGRRETDLAAETITAAAGEDFDWRAARSDATERRAALERMTKWASGRTGRELAWKPLANPTGTWAGLEVRSCRNGDLFLRWNADGVAVGLLGRDRFPLPKAATERIAELVARIESDGVRGNVVCDFLRLRDESVEKHVKFAPAELPITDTPWLIELVRAIDDAGRSELATAVLDRQSQFLEAADK